MNLLAANLSPDLYTLAWESVERRFPYSAGRFLPATINGIATCSVASRRALQWVISSLHQRYKRPKRSRMTIEEQLARVRNGFKVLQCSAKVDEQETTVKENVSTLNYVTPHFRAEAEVETPRLKEGEIYTVGWVQAVTEMKFFNH